MSKIIFIIVVILVAVGGGIFLAVKLTENPQSTKSNNQNSLINSDSNEDKEQNLAAESTYEDTAGFSFKYPSSIKVTDVTPSGDTYYSVLNLSANEGQMKITVQDSTYKSVDEWLTKNNGAKLVGAASLGDVPAKQYETNTSLYSVALDQGVLYVLESPKSDAYWAKTHEIVVDSFTFVDSAPSKATSGEAGSAIYESEEVVE